ncbi:MAG: hypothetical protein R2798_11475 [Chitinophagales bacterium]|nr:hypothetical protein [Bacteroidota bacterium]MCB9043172.1 hypothetical protein [Chitinophagales bacterium]
MKQSFLSVVILILATAFLSSCGPKQSEIDAQIRAKVSNAIDSVSQVLNEDCSNRIALERETLQMQVDSLSLALENASSKGKTSSSSGSKSTNSVASKPSTSTGSSSSSSSSTTTTTTTTSSTPKKVDVTQRRGATKK